MTASATVAVLGPGAVGGVLAVGLVRSGVRVICIARPDTAALIASEGLTLKHGPGWFGSTDDSKLLTETLSRP